MKYSINFSDRYGNETDNIEVTISENSIEIPDLDFNGTLDTLYKTRGFFVETGTVSLPVGKKYPKGGIFSMKKLLKFVGLSREKEVVPEVPNVPEVPEVPDVPDAPKTTCFVLSQDNKLVYLGEYNKGILDRAAAYVKRAKKTVSLYHNGQAPVVFPHVA